MPTVKKTGQTNHDTHLQFKKTQLFSQVAMARALEEARPRHCKGQLFSVLFGCSAVYGPKSKTSAEIGKPKAQTRINRTEGGSNKSWCILSINVSFLRDDINM